CRRAARCRWGKAVALSVGSTDDSRNRVVDTEAAECQTRVPADVILHSVFLMTTLICYDGSDSAKHALTVAHDTLGHRPVTLLHVWTAPAAVLADAFSTRSDGPSRE